MCQGLGHSVQPPTQDVSTEKLCSPKASRPMGQKPGDMAAKEDRWSREGLLRSGDAASSTSHALDLQQLPIFIISNCVRYYHVQ